jgi:hypothetical protein
VYIRLFRKKNHFIWNKGSSRYFLRSFLIDSNLVQSCTKSESIKRDLRDSSHGRTQGSYSPAAAQACRWSETINRVLFT